MMSRCHDAALRSGENKVTFFSFSGIAHEKDTIE